jgi:hypothetical protein
MIFSVVHPEAPPVARARALPRIRKGAPVEKPVPMPLTPTNKRMHTTQEDKNEVDTLRCDQQKKEAAYQKSKRERGRGGDKARRKGQNAKAVERDDTEKGKKVKDRVEEGKERGGRKERGGEQKKTSLNKRHGVPAKSTAVVTGIGHMIDPSAVVTPLAQGMNVVMPIDGHMVLAGQNAHTALPVTFANVPFTQVMQLLAEIAPLMAEEVPTGQGIPVFQYPTIRSIKSKTNVCL